MQKNYHCIIILICLLWVGCTEDLSKSNAPGSRHDVAKNAMVVSAHPLASVIGIDILKNGGNAIDAAVAVHFALAVAYPAAGNIGGGGFMVLRLANGDNYALDYREKAPESANKNMYLDKNGDVIKDLSLKGHLAAGVPGTVDGMVSAHERFGKLDWAIVVQPSIDLALNGFPLTQKEADGLNKAQNKMIQYSTLHPAFLSKDSWKKGDTIKFKELGYTLERIRDYGRDGFYAGETAEMLVAEMERGSGMITLNDLSNYHSVWRKPIKGKYKNYTVLSMPPPSSGGIALMQLLKMVEPFPIQEWGFHNPETIHLMVEAERRAYADRATYLGDPDFVRVPIQELLNDSYLLSRMESFDPMAATKSSSIAAGQLPRIESEETTHYSIVDKKGNAVSVTTTLNGAYGSYVVVGKAGFLLNNEMDDFSSKPGSPNLYGLVGGEANSIAPGKRMLSSMTPTILEKEGQLFMVLGTPGGSTIITSVFQTILNTIEFGMGMQDAVDKPRFHHQWLPDQIYYEHNALDSSMINLLTGKGHVLKSRSTIGRVDAIRVLENGDLEGGADSRGDDVAQGY